MSRIRINPYGASKGAKELANYLGVKRLRVPTSALSGGARTGSQFRGKYSDVVINWGNGKGNVGNARQINNLQNVQLASNKLSTLGRLIEEGVRTPNFLTEQPRAYEGETYVARTTLYGHSGEGIVVGKIGELPGAPLYVEYIKKTAEYRVIVVGDEAVDVKQKLKKRDFEGDRSEYVWNCDNGYIFARNDITIPTGLNELGVAAVKALGLDFGAVDIIQDEGGRLYVLEVNTAFGLEGQTISLVGDAIRELL